MFLNKMSAFKRHAMIKRN